MFCCLLDYLDFYTLLELSPDLSGICNHLKYSGALTTLSVDNLSKLSALSEKNICQNEDSEAFSPVKTISSFNDFITVAF